MTITVRDSCKGCKYFNLSEYDEPCYDCWDSSKYETDEHQENKSEINTEPPEVKGESQEVEEPQPSIYSSLTFEDVCRIHDAATDYISHCSIADLLIISNFIEKMRNTQHPTFSEDN